MDLSKCLEKIQENLKTAEEQVAILKDLEITVLKQITFVQCRQCGAKHSIGDLMYIQTHWHVPPSGCTDGDYYLSGEGQWDCPSCGSCNRLHQLPEVTALRPLFAGLHHCYCNTDRSLCSDQRPCEACKSAGRTRDGGGWRR